MRSRAEVNASEKRLKIEVRAFIANFRNVLFHFFPSCFADHKNVASGRGLCVSVSQVCSLMRIIFVQFTG